METSIGTSETSALELRFQEHVTLEKFVAAQTLHLGWRWLWLLFFPVARIALLQGASERGHH